MKERKKYNEKELFMHFIQWSIYSFVFFGLIIWLRLTWTPERFKFDIAVFAGFITGILFTMALLFLARYQEEKKEANQNGKV